MKTKAYSRAERKEQIKTTILIAIQNGLGNGRSMYQIAKSLDMSPSSHLMGMLKELWWAGELRLDFVEHRPGLHKSIWKLPDQSYVMPTRAINLNINGKPANQLELAI